MPPDICRLLDKVLLTLLRTLIHRGLCNMFHSLFIHRSNSPFKDTQGYFLYVNNTVKGEALVLRESEVLMTKERYLFKSTSLC